MRKITKQIQAAFLGARPFANGPSDRARYRDQVSVHAASETGFDQSRVEYRLHGSLIAKATVTNGVVHDVQITTAGWDTPTTRDRLGAFGPKPYRHKGDLHLGGAPWDGRWITFPSHP